LRRPGIDTVIRLHAEGRIDWVNGTIFDPAALRPRATTRTFRLCPRPGPTFIAEVRNPVHGLAPKPAWPRAFVLARPGGVPAGFEERMAIDIDIGMTFAPTSKS